MALTGAIHEKPWDIFVENDSTGSVVVNQPFSELWVDVSPAISTTPPNIVVGTWFKAGKPKRKRSGFYVSESNTYFADIQYDGAQTLTIKMYNGSSVLATCYADVYCR